MWLLFRKGLMCLSFLQTDEPNYFPELGFWIFSILNGSNHIKRGLEATRTPFLSIQSSFMSLFENQRKSQKMGMYPRVNPVVFIFWQNLLKDFEWTRKTPVWHPICLRKSRLEIGILSNFSALWYMREGFFFFWFFQLSPFILEIEKKNYLIHRSLALVKMDW